MTGVILCVLANMVVLGMCETGNGGWEVPETSSLRISQWYDRFDTPTLYVYRCI